VTHIATGRGVGVVLTTKARAMELAREFGERPEWAMLRMLQLTETTTN
jgi:hypothetical protein